MSISKTEKGKVAATTLPKAGSKASRFTPEQILQLEDEAVKRMKRVIHNMPSEEFSKCGLPKCVLSSDENMDFYIRPMVKGTLKYHLEKEGLK